MLTKLPRQSLLLVYLSVFIIAACGKKGGMAPTPPPPATTFTNPLRNGADPWIVKKDGFYYYTQTMGNRIVLWKTASVSALASATMTTVFTPVAGAPNSSNIWAPEIHFISGKWYIYYTAGSGPDQTQRTWVLENSHADPTAGAWVDKGRIFASNADFWAIDGSIMSYNNNLYFIWSGRPDPSIQNQHIYIAKMSSPLALETATTISSPLLSWEVNGGPVNEAPEHLTKNNKHFLIYSASGCWTDQYALGMLTLQAGSDPLVAANWTKSPQPVFTSNPPGHVYGPGHNAFFQSKDGMEDWIVYHANSNPNEGCADRRNIRMQKITWNTDTTPNFGIPVATGTSMTKPGGE